MRPLYFASSNQMLNVLFICGKNRLQNPSAEQVFSAYPGVLCTEVELGPNARKPVTAAQVAAADLIFVMEKTQQLRLMEKFTPQISGQRIICLDIPEDYAFLAPPLINLLMSKVTQTRAA